MFSHLADSNESRHVWSVLSSNWVKPVLPLIPWQHTPEMFFICKTSSLVHWSREKTTDWKEPRREDGKCTNSPEITESYGWQDGKSSKSSRVNFLNEGVKLAARYYFHKFAWTHHFPSLDMRLQTWRWAQDNINTTDVRVVQGDTYVVKASANGGAGTICSLVITGYKRDVTFKFFSAWWCWEVCFLKTVIAQIWRRSIMYCALPSRYIYIYTPRDL